MVAITAGAALVLTPLAGKLAWKFSAVSRPDGQRKLHAQPTPLWGGVALYIALLLGMATCLVILPGATNLMALAIAIGLSAGILCLLGCCDDILEINARWKLLGQVLATLPIVAAGFYVERLTLFGFTAELGWLAVPWTIGWLVLGINALNLLDGMDGLASSAGVLISVAIAIIAASQGHAAVALLALVCAAAIGGFLVHNLPTARIYLGDCGSTVIGLVLALLAMLASSSTAGTANLTVAAAIMFLPLADTGLAIARRTLQGHSFMVADRHHVHHQLLDRGLNVWQVLGCLATFCLVTQAIAWLAIAPGREIWAEIWTWTALAAIVAVSIAMRVVGHREWTLARRFAVRMMSRTVAAVLRQPLAAGWRNHAEMDDTGRSILVADQPTSLSVSGSHSSLPAARDRHTAAVAAESGVQGKAA
ncbi:MAG: undecaprenyl/decaprenyl-phosphate alpha-N-acetylglucosaminyl 1-phosphate transferase [Candidatus Nealsonbacteria bacterium]|nr:undecaprenyl/decaprenyl-phosphate alpha-N-acetylglucosaminyl 1-phosphate transferase [Candidatus Nealsonbacteria bacterium]